MSKLPSLFSPRWLDCVGLTRAPRLANQIPVCGIGCMDQSFPPQREAGSWNFLFTSSVLYMGEGILYLLATASVLRWVVRLCQTYQIYRIDEKHAHPLVKLGLWMHKSSPSLSWVKLRAIESLLDPMAMQWGRDSS